MTKLSTCWLICRGRSALYVNMLLGGNSCSTQLKLTVVISKLETPLSFKRRIFIRIDSATVPLTLWCTRWSHAHPLEVRSRRFCSPGWTGGTPVSHHSRPVNTSIIASNKKKKNLDCLLKNVKLFLLKINI